MRLQNPASKQKGLTGPNADIVDQLLTTKKKRSRPISSSLEFQASDRNLITTAKSTSAKNKPRAKNHQQPPPQITATRARGSGGIPKMKLQLQDLEGMAEDEILQALYEDPELAAAAAAAAADTNRSQQSKDPPPKTTRRQQKLSKYSTHIKDMTDQGIPYKQWIILLLLLGVAAYQIYKALKPPQTSKKRGGSKGVTIPKKTKSVGDKGKRKKAETKKSVAVKAEIQNPADTKAKPAIPSVDNTAESPDTKPRDKTTATSAKKKKAKDPATETAKSPGIAEKKVQHPESPDSVSTDGSSSSNDGAVHVPSKEVKEKKSAKEKKASIKSGGSKKNEESVEGWQMIGEKPSPPDTSSAPKNVVSSNGDLPAKSQTGKPGKSLTASLEEAKVANDENAGMKAETLSNAPVKGDNANEKAKRNRKKKTKTENVVASSVISAPATDDDAVIALKLQKEEEKLAEATDRAESEPEVWKEVATKKRKGAAPMEVATTDQSDVVDETS